MLKDKLKVVSLYLIIACVWGWGYVRVIVPTFGYEGYYLNYSFIRILVSLVIVAFISVILPTRIRNFSDFYIHFQFLFPLLPMIILYSLSGFSLVFLVYSIIAFVAIIVLTRPKLRFFRIRGVIISLTSTQNLFKLFLLVCLIVLVVLAFRFGGQFNLDIKKIYDLRPIFVSKLSFIGRYMYSVVFKTVLGFLIAYSLIYSKRKMLFFSIFFVISVLAFGFTTMKVFLFQPIVMLVIFVCLRLRNTPNLFLGFLVFGSILVTLGSRFHAGVVLASLFLRRVVFVPAMLNYHYFNFFSANPKVFWTDSLWLPIRLFYRYPYDLPMSHVIGWMYFNNPNCGANTGWIGSGYAHAGFWGMMFYALIISWIFRFVDKMERKWNRDFLIIAFFPVAVAVLFSSDLKTCVLSHGLLLYVLILYFWKGYIGYLERKRSAERSKVKKAFYRVSDWRK